MPKSLYSAPARELAQLLAETRIAAGVTQVQLAKRLNRPQPVISLMERGERRIDVVEFCDIAEALGVAPERLFLEFTARRKGG